MANPQLSILVLFLFEILEVVITPLRIKVRNIRNYAVTTGVRSVIDNEDERIKKKVK